MTSATIDVGIDLGTSNSAGAVAQEGEVEVIPNNDGGNITPSVVRFWPNGSVEIGKKAYEHLLIRDDGSAFGGFKRDMGRQRTLPVASTGGNVTPEALAAELLKSLRADAESFTGHPVSAAVITVPAMFELAQCEATQRAAERAGITQAPLLQEPIAAGLAYGYERDLADAYFLVYDLGGGTFDVTLMRVSDGSLTVVDTGGDNRLGGRDMDRKLAGLLAQRLVSAGYRLWAPDDSAGQEFVRRLALLAEAEKIRLSRDEQVNVRFEGDLRDADRRPIETTIPVARSEYEQLIAPDIERSIDILQRVLEHQHLPPSAVAQIVLVGGPTKTPLLRRMVASLTGISVENRLNPMTVVAEGAARFAAGVLREGRTTPRLATGTLIRFALSYPAVTDDLVAPVGGRVEGGSADGLSVEIRRTDGGWSSGRIPLQSGAFFTSIALLARRPNTFEITCLDEAGRRIPVSPDKFTVTQGLMVADPPLARSVVVAALDAQGKEVSHLMLPKGTSLPAVAKYRFRATRTVAPGRPDDALNVHVLEGEYERPDLNRHVGQLRIAGDLLDRVLPENTPVEVTLRIDASRKSTVSAYVPLLDRTFEQVLTNVFLLDDDPLMIENDLENDLARAQDVIRSPRELARLWANAQEIRNDIAAAFAGDSDAGSRADQRRKELANEIDQLLKQSEPYRLVEEVNNALTWAQQLANDHGDAAQRQRLALLRAEVETAASGGRREELVRVRDEIHRLQWQIVWNVPSFWVDHFIYLTDRIGSGPFAGQAAPLMAHGRTALDRQDMEALRDVCRQLWDWLPDDERRASGLSDIGIRRD